MGIIACLAGCFDNAATRSSGLSAAPSSITITVGSSIALTLHNTNDAALNGITVTPSANLSGLTVQGNCSTIPAQGQCILTVTAQVNAALGTGTITISGQNTSPLTIPVQVKLPVNSALSLDKTMLALYQNAGSSSITLTNTGNVNLTDILLNNLPSGVNANGGCSSLAVGDQCTFTFTASNSSTVGVYTTATLRASGIAPIRLVIQVSPENQGPTATTLAIVNPPANGLFITAGSSAQITLQNTGFNPIDGPVLYIAGISDSYLSVNSDNCTNLAANSTCMVMISTVSTTPNHTSGSITFNASNVNNTDNPATTVLHIGLPGLHLNASSFSIVQGGAQDIIVTNNGTAATNVVLSGLPGDVTTTSTCPNLPYNGSCTFTLHANSSVTPGETTVNVSDDQGDLLPFTLNVEQVQISSPDVSNQNNIYIPVGGSTSITIQNESTELTADNVTVNNGLPNGVSVTANTCDSINPGANCTITFTAASNADVTSNPVPIIVQGDDTNPLAGQVMVEQPSFSMTYSDSANITFPAYGDITLTVANNSHFEVDNVTPSVSDGTGQITLESTNNSCSTLAPVQSTTAPSTCTFELNATANATTTDNPTITVTGQLASPNTAISVSAQAPIGLAGPTVTINGGNIINMPGGNGDILSVPVAVTGFNVQGPQLSLNLGDNTANISSSLRDANNPANPCSDPFAAESNCVIVLSNQADLDISGTNGNGILTVSGSNLSTPATRSVSVIGGLAINYIGLNDSNAGTYYVSAINGPRYGVILLNNLSTTDSFTINTLSLSADTDPSITIDGTAGDYGSNPECMANAILAPGDHCIVVLNGANQKSVGIKTGSLTISATDAANSSITASRTFSLTNTGYLYAAGQFSSPGANIAKWDGTTWSALGDGISGGVVYALTADSPGNVYAGGQFTASGTTSLSNIGKWNGSTWSALGTGITGTGTSVQALITDDSGDLYAGGTFSSPGNHIAEWNGIAWSPLNSGISGPVYSLAIDGVENLYAGGSFTTAGSTSLSNIAKWNSTAATWSALGSGISGPVYSLAIDGLGNLYAGGSFTASGTTSLSNIAEWNSTAATWSALGSGIGTSANAVRALTVDSTGNIYAGGQFSSPGVNIAEWNSTAAAWSALDSGIGTSSNFVRALTIDSAGNLYAGGQFTASGLTSLSNIAEWNGSAWSALGTGASGSNAQIFALTMGNVLQVN